MPDCPRCKVALASQSAAPAEGSAPLSIDVCPACAGLWLDGAELAACSASLGGLPNRLSEILTVAVPSPFACPRCKGLLLGFDLLGTPVDLCRDCSGVWLDGGEFQQLATAERGPAPAARPKLPDAVACKGCGKSVPLGSAYYSDRGLVCVDCHQSSDSPQAIDDRSADARAAYAAHEQQQVAIRAANRGIPPTKTYDDELRDLKREIRYLRWKSDH